MVKATGGEDLLKMPSQTNMNARAACHIMPLGQMIVSFTRRKIGHFPGVSGWLPALACKGASAGANWLSSFDLNF